MMIPILDRNGNKVDETNDAANFGIIVRTTFSSNNIHSPDFNHPETKFYRFNDSFLHPAFVECNVMTIMQ
jgi:hypothetical protein